ncbi:MAG: hypothetical protein Q9M15_06555 [Mariprofundaceae bacterium]|nr:hypothetical protein [Mariprofundaceae bacterium]
MQALQEELTQYLGLSIQLSCKKKSSGELKIRYGRAEELDGLLNETLAILVILEITKGCGDGEK